MKAKDIIEAAKKNLRIEDNESDTLLLFNLKNVLNEVATEFIPVYTEETVKAVNGEVELSALTLIPVKITSVKNRESNLSFTETPFRIFIKPRVDGEVVLTYSYLPLIASQEDELPYRDLMLRTFAFGLCAEYCLVSGLEADAEMWDMRYKDAVKEAAFPHGEHKIKKRGWY